MSLESSNINALESLSKVLAANMRRLRKARGKMTQSALAAHIGMSLRAVQDIEYGDSWPQLETLQAIAATFKVEPWELLRSPSPPDSPADAKLISDVRTLSPAQKEHLAVFLTSLRNLNNERR